MYTTKVCRQTCLSGLSADFSMVFLLRFILSNLHFIILFRLMQQNFYELSISLPFSVALICFFRYAASSPVCIFLSAPLFWNAFLPFCPLCYLTTPFHQHLIRNLPHLPAFPICCLFQSTSSSRNCRRKSRTSHKRAPFPSPP